VKEIASRLFDIEEESTVIDSFGDETFKAERFNLICRLDEEITALPRSLWVVLMRCLL
jgi:hypothetical protein